MNETREIRRACQWIGPITLLLCLALIAVTVIACGNSPAPPEEKEANPESPLVLSVVSSWSLDNATHQEPMLVTGVTATEANTLFVVLIASDSGQGPRRGGPPLDGKVENVAGGGLAWTRRAEAHLSTTGAPGIAEIWTAFSREPVDPFTVTVTRNDDQGGLTYCDNYSGGSGPDIANGMVYVQAITGADPDNPVGATAIAGFGRYAGQMGTAFITLTTTRPDSLVEAVGTDWSEPTPRTLPAGQVMLHESKNMPNGDDYWVQGFPSTISTAGPVTLSVLDPTDDNINLAVIEILRASR